MVDEIIYNKMLGCKYSNLTVIGFDLQTGVKKRIICKCDCGNTIQVTARQLKMNKRKSCGCLRSKNVQSYQKMVGQKINKWTILEFCYDKQSPSFKCQCECGTIKNVLVYNLLKGTSKDCGCGRKNNLSKAKSKNYLGMRFGKLVVVEKMAESNKFKRLMYRCKCDCGNEIIVPSQSLVTHHTSSCGCILSYYNMFIDKFLDSLKIEHRSEYTVNVDDKYYRFDFYLPTYNMMIEYDGEQHYKPVKHYCCSNEDAELKLKKVQQSDSVKNKYCADNGIHLLRIPYWDKNNIETIIKTCLQRLSERDTEWCMQQSELTQ